MPQYLVANYLPDDFDPSTVTEVMIEEIHALDRELIAAGVRKFACGISPARQREDAAEAARRQGGRDRRTVLRDQGAHGGFWILECADLEEALAWARKGAMSCDAAGEVRELLVFPAPEQGSDGSK